MAVYEDHMSFIGIVQSSTVGDDYSMARIRKQPKRKAAIIDMAAFQKAHKYKLATSIEFLTL